MPDAFHAADAVEPTTLTRPLKPLKSPTKSVAIQKHDSKVGGVAGKKQAAAQKVTMDTSQKVKFAIVNTQNTSMQMNLSQRHRGRVLGKETSSLAVDRKSHGKPNLTASRARHDRQANIVSSEGSESRPFSRPTGTDSHLSASSYQRYIISQTTDYRNIDSSNLTTKAANTPAPFIIEQGVSVSVSGVESSFQPSKVDVSSKCYESFQGDEMSEGSDILSQSVSQLEGETDSESYSRPENCSSYSMTEEQMDSPLQGEMVSKPQSGRVTIEVDMRFSSSIDRPVSELSQLSSSLAGGDSGGAGDDGLTMSAVSEQSHTASSQDGSQLHTPHSSEAGNEVDMGAMESERGSELESTSALSVDMSDIRSGYQESKRGEEGEGDIREEDTVEIGMDDAELQASQLVLQRQEEAEHGSQPYSAGSRSKRSSSISYKSDVESQPRSSVRSSRIDLEDLNAMKGEYFDKESMTVASMERLEERAPALSTTDKPEDTHTSIYDRELLDGTTHPQTVTYPQDHSSKSSIVLHGSQSSSGHKLSSSPCSRSLSSIGMPPSYSIPASQDVTTISSSQQQYRSLTPTSQSVTTASSHTRSQRSSFGSVPSSQHQLDSLTPSQQSLTTATATSQTRSQRSSYGSVPESSVPSIKPSATHMMIEGLQHLSTSGSHADTSSWLLAHHSGSKIRSEVPASDERSRDAVDLVQGEDSYDKESVTSEIEVNDSKSILGENLQHESRSKLGQQTFDLRESSSICFTSPKADESAQGADITQKFDSQTHLNVHDAGVPTVQVEPTEIKVVVSSESQESVPTERGFTMADLIETHVHAEVSDMIDTADSRKSKETSDSAPVNLAVSIQACQYPVVIFFYTCTYIPLYVQCTYAGVSSILK